MWIIQELAEMAFEETEGAEHYITRAIQLREKRPKLADALSKMSADEMVHSKMLMDMAEAVIESSKQDNSEELSKVLPVYNYIRRSQIEKSAHVKVKQTMYKEGA